MLKTALVVAALAAFFIPKAHAADVALTPKNCRIQFVGTHAGEKPDPRTGHFAKFSGTAAVDAGKLKSVAVNIDTKSLATDIDRLTNHLKSPDFFNVNEHPTAKFVSKSIESTPDGKTKITGELTLLGTTKSISFPAAVTTDGGLSLKAEFPIDRTAFGMNYGVDRVEKTVQMTVTVGK
jgi:polyisoprenoid-binding protein YceI